MNRFLAASLLFSALHALAGCTADAADASDTEEQTETASAPMKWTPLPGEWVACDLNGMKCRCKGDVIDCRGATGDGGTKAMSSAFTADLTSGAVLTAP